MKTKIDVSQIEGFDTMSAEEQVKALMDFEYEDNAETLKNYKDNIDRLSHEVSKTKKDSASEIAKLQEDLKSRMNESELAKKEHEDYVKALEEQNAKFKAEQRVSNYTAKLMECGYDTESAKKMAENLPEGIGEDFFEGQKSFLEAKSKQYEEQALKKQPEPTPGDPLIVDTEMEQMRKWAGLN